MIAAPLVALLLVKLMIPENVSDESTTFKAVALLLAKEQFSNVIPEEL